MRQWGAWGAAGWLGSDDSMTSGTVGFGWLNSTVLVLYLAAMVGIGWYFGRRVKNTRDYFLGGGKVNYVLVGLSLLGTYLSALTMISLPGWAFGDKNLAWTIQLPCLLLTAAVITCLVLPRYRAAGVVSIYEFLEQRIHVSARLLASLSYVVYSIGRMGLTLYLPAVAFSTVTGVPLAWSIIVMGLVVTIYTTMGGLEGVIWTDAIQVCIFTGAAFLSFLYMFTAIAQTTGHMPSMWWSVSQGVIALLVGWAISQWLLPALERSVPERGAMGWPRREDVGDVAVQALQLVVLGLLLAVFGPLNIGWSVIVFSGSALAKMLLSGCCGRNRSERLRLYGAGLAVICGAFILFLWDQRTAQPVWWAVLQTIVTVLLGWLIGGLVEDLPEVDSEISGATTETFLLLLVVACVTSLVFRMSVGWALLFSAVAVGVHGYGAARREGRPTPVHLLAAVAGAVVAGGVFVFQTGTGADFLAVSHQFGKLKVFRGGLNLKEITSTWLVLETLVQTIRIYSTTQDMAQRFMATKSTEEANRSVWISILACIPLTYMFYFMGTVLFCFYHFHPDGQLATMLKSNMDVLYPFFALTQLPVGVAGLVIAAIFAAAQSTISSSMNSCSTVCVEDFYKRFVPIYSWSQARDAVAGDEHHGDQMVSLTDDPELHCLRVAKGLALVWGLLATVMALFLIGTESAVPIWHKIMAFCTNGVLAMLILALLPRKYDAWSAIVGFVGGYVFLFWLVFPHYFVHDGEPRVSYLLYAVFGNLVSLLLSLLAQWVIDWARAKGAPVPEAPALPPTEDGSAP